MRASVDSSSTMVTDNTRMRRKRMRPFELNGSTSLGVYEGDVVSITAAEMGDKQKSEVEELGSVRLSEDRDNLIIEMLKRQSYLLGNNFGDAASAYGLGTANIEENEKSLLIASYIEQNIVDNIQALDTTTVRNNYTAHRSKKQRTISLPQLPHSKLYYRFVCPGKYDENFGDGGTCMPCSVQNDDELFHSSGSSNTTLNSNRAVKLPIISSLSPNSNAPIAFSGIDMTNIEKSVPTIATNSVKMLQPKLGKLLGRKQQAINRDYFITDKDGHYVYTEDDLIANGRFITKQLLGQGTFGKVVKCIDNQKSSKKYVAIKIIRAVDRYRQAAKIELRVLQTIREHDPLGTYQCLLLRECFDYKNHICLVTDLFGRSIYDFMCSNGNPRFPGSHVQAISRQLIRSVCFLHDLGVIHTDLKPENILICDESYVEKPLSESVLAMLSSRRKLASREKQMILTNPEVKLIDFGSAVFSQEYHPPVISTRHYRAPEVVLGLGWSFPCDIWSIGCVLVELVTGESLYPIHENLEHLAIMQRVNGESLPKKMVEKMFYKVEHNISILPSDLIKTVVRHFDKISMTLQWPERNYKGEVVTEEKSINRVMNTSGRLDKLISAKLQKDIGEWLIIDWDYTLEQNWSTIESKFYSINVTLDRETFLFWYWFVDLCRKMFEFDPTKRITAKEAMDHEWFNYGILDDGISSYRQV